MKQPYKRQTQRKPVQLGLFMRKKAVESNKMAAEVILADVAKFGGETSLMVMWARKVA